MRRAFASIAPLLTQLLPIMIVPKSVFAHYMVSPHSYSLLPFPCLLPLFLLSSHAPFIHSSLTLTLSSSQVGLTLNQTTDQWKHDIRLASEASIDGFALNIGPADYFTYSSLHTAYEAAATFTNFSLFLSFDFASSTPDKNWDVDYIANLTNTFKDEPAQFKVDGKPFVSTFEGVEYKEDWKEVRNRVEGGIVFVPDWSSIGPEGVRRVVDDVEGACELSFLFLLQHYPFPSSVLFPLPIFFLSPLLFFASPFSPLESHKVLTPTSLIRRLAPRLSIPTHHLFRRRLLIRLIRLFPLPQQQICCPKQQNLHDGHLPLLLHLSFVIQQKLVLPLRHPLAYSLITSPFHFP